ncbi:EnvZ/OmpR regulon moderator MzrA [Pectobacterium cacticida]|uniref:Modulator protein MzrA n=2 Tax=Pectobacterium cacticida TaxID=69221 RepID=A0ABZ2GC38_9GAMM|nr:EnvZ/OmpR regulon moderator MzrA [Pectobacterium cacticida]UYX06421.1 EnvZ/OmpR regulon moderator MzrA [Pectobacterium cacticida]
MSIHWLSSKFTFRHIGRMLLLLALLTIVLTQSLSPRHAHDDAMLHIKPYAGAALPDGFYVYQRLNEKGIEIKSITPEQDSLVVRLVSPEQSIAARDILRLSLPKVSITAQLTTAPTPFWQHKLTQKQSKLG